MAGLYALAADFFASFWVVQVLVCTFTPFLEYGCLIKTRLPPTLVFCIIYYNYTTRRAWGWQETCSACRVSLTTRTRSSPNQSRSTPSRSLGGERDQGLCYVSTFYTTLVRKSREANGAFEHLRKLRPRIRVHKGVAVLNPRPQLSVFPLTRSGLRSRHPPC